MILTFEQAAHNKSDSDSADGVMFRSSYSSAGFLWCAFLKCVNGCHHLATSSAVDSFGVLTIVMLLDLFGFIGICIWLAVCGRCLRVVCYVCCWCILGFGFQRDADCLCWCCLWLCNCVCVFSCLNLLMISILMWWPPVFWQWLYFRLRCWCCLSVFLVRFLLMFRFLLPSICNSIS